MFTMTKRTVVMITFLVFLLGAGTCFAESAVPNLVGSWAVKAEGGVLLKGSTYGPKTHYTDEFDTLTAEAIVTKQEGRIFHGIFKSPKATEKIIGVIGIDNKSFYATDEDGTIDGKILSKDKIAIIYRHITTSDTVVAVATWTKKK